MKYDIVVIGSGPGGYVAAIRAAQLGKRTAIVEKAELGGVCLNWGCIPTKALIKSAQVWNYVSSASHYGVEIEGVARPVMSRIVDRSRGVADTMSKGVAFLLKKNNVDVLCGHGRLIGDGKVRVCGEEELVVEADHIILATGARPREMPFMKVDGEKIINSRHALVLDKVPESIVVVGTGAIGSEFAYLYASLGSKVTLVEYLPQMLPLEDEEVSKYMERSFRKLRATVMTATTVTAVDIDPSSGKCLVRTEGKKGEQTLEADVVLSAVGIKTNIEDLGLEEIGVAVERDKVVVNNFFETNVRGVYAIGDLIATPALAHVASAEAICCVEKICGLEPEAVDYTVVPSCVYTTPEVASVGLTEKQAVEAGMEVRVGKFPYTASGKATAAGDRDGFVKLVFEKDTDKLLGAHLVGLNVTEMIAEPSLAITLGVTAHQLAKVIHAHPTMNEGIMEAAEAAHDSAIHV